MGLPEILWSNLESKREKKYRILFLIDISQKFIIFIQVLASFI